MTINLAILWDFNKPDVSEERFRSAISTASGDDAIILQTQIARTYGLRGDFSKAKQILAEIEPQLKNAGDEARVHYYLELGRTYSSAAHPPGSQTDRVKELARSAYLQAAELAQNSKLDNLAIDALHMMAFVDTAPEEQIEWNRKALALVELSSQPDAKKWEGSLHNNIGYALHLLGRYEAALLEFNSALVTHEKGGNHQNIRIAHWMIAWTLRALGRLQEAIDIQLRLEKECAESGEPDPFVFEELELLYQAVGEMDKSEYYAARRETVSKTSGK
jgi:tetratricopeptide (TPR) repeat protein